MNNKQNNYYNWIIKNLKLKYKISFLFFYKNKIDEIMYNKNISNIIFLKDINIFDRSNEILKCYYNKYESNLRLVKYVRPLNKIELNLVPNWSKIKLFKIIILREFKIFKLKNKTCHDNKIKKSKRKNLNNNILRKLKKSEFLIDVEVSSLLINKRIKNRNKSLNFSYLINKKLKDNCISFSNSEHDIHDPKWSNNFNSSLSATFSNSFISSFNKSINNTILLNLSNITSGYKKINSKNFLNSDIKILRNELNIKLSNKIDKNNKESKITNKLNSKDSWNKKNLFNLDLKNIKSNISNNTNINNSIRNIEMNLKNTKKFKKFDKNIIKKIKKNFKNIKLENKLNLNFKDSKSKNYNKNINTERKINNIKWLKISNNNIKNSKDSSKNINNKKMIFYKKNSQNNYNNNKNTKKISHLFNLNLKSFIKSKSKKYKTKEIFKNITKNKNSFTQRILIKNFNNNGGKEIKTFRNKKLYESVKNKEKIIKSSRPKIKKPKNKSKKKKWIKLEIFKIYNSTPNFKKIKKIKLN